MPVPPASGLHKSVRDALPVRLGDRKYNIDVTRLVRSTIDPIRQGFDTQGQPGEQSLNQAGVWKRSRNDWELGAGQREADSPESALRRFNTSLGVNPWVKNELTLHKATAETRSTSNSDLFMVVADSGTERAYIADGSDVYQSTNGTAWTVISNPAGGAITAMATDGYYVYVASAAGAGEIQRISGTAVSGASLNTDHWVIDDVDGLWIANGYLITSIAKRLTVVSVGSALATNADITSAAFTQVSEWKSVIGTPVGIYAAGNQGDQGKIYYVGINDSTSALNVPVIVAELPLGEKINVLAEYGGLLIIGTTKGIRVAQITGQGYLTYGPRIDITNGVSVLEPQGEFVWFGWKNYNGTNTGLGRLSLKELTGPLVPAYASDLMAVAQGDIEGVVTLGDIRIFSVAGEGAYREQDTYVTSGTVDEGRFRWGITELKTAVSVDLRHGALIADQSIAITLTDDAGGTDTITSDTVGNVTPDIQVAEGVTGEYITPSLTLTGTAAATPTLYRWTTRAIPMPFVAEVIALPIILTTFTEHDNREVYQDIYEDYTYLRTLLEDRKLVTFIIGNETKNVYVSGLAYAEGSIYKWSDSIQRLENRRDRWVEGVITVTLITVQTGVTLVPTDVSSNG